MQSVHGRAAVPRPPVNHKLAGQLKIIVRRMVVLPACRRDRVTGKKHGTIFGL